ncbi:MAG: hypothetical protein ACLP5V_06390 [Candidatus Bathyarchaeia archaeon]
MPVSVVIVPLTVAVWVEVLVVLALAIVPLILTSVPIGPVGGNRSRKLVVAATGGRGTGANVWDCAVVAAKADRTSSSVTKYLTRRRIKPCTSLKLSVEAMFDDI